MKRILLSQAKFALVDDCDYSWLSQWKWRFDGGYAVRWSRKAEGFTPRKIILMHRAILEKQGFRDFEQTDHKNEDKLDNRRENLRPATYGQNVVNYKRTGGSSKYRGVCWHEADKRWRAQIGANGHRNLGAFTDEVEAAKAYNKAALKLHGEFARLNEV